MHKKRVQSPSSINTYKQCARKYFYKYIAELPSKPSVHLIRGKVVHAVLEEFFDIDISSITFENYKAILRQKMQELFLAHWQFNQQLFHDIEINNDQERFYFSESLLMALNWLDHLILRMKQHPAPTFQETFAQFIPIREEEYLSTDLAVHGFMDAIESVNGKTTIIDYKTNTNMSISEEQRLQLGIYALLYKEKHGVLPDSTGIFFLRSRPKFIPINNELLENALNNINLIHEKTSTDKIDDYPLKPGPLCSWCDFYKICFEQKTPDDYRAENTAALMAPPPKTGQK